MKKRTQIIRMLKCSQFRETEPRATNGGFLSNASKRYFRLSRVFLTLCRLILGCVFFLSWSVWSFQGNLSDFEFVRAIYCYFQKTLSLITFPKIIADPQDNYFLWIRIKQALIKLFMSRKLKVTILQRESEGIKVLSERKIYRNYPFGAPTEPYSSTVARDYDNILSPSCDRVQCS